MEVPEHRVVGNIRSGVSFIGPAHEWKLDWIPYEENLKIVEHKVLYTLLGVELGSKAAEVAGSVTESLLTAYI